METWNPHQYQLRAMEHAVTRTDGAVALFLDPGLGKTSISYGVISVLKSHKMFKRALVIAPRRPMMSSWPREQSKWAQFADITIATAYGDKTARENALRSSSDILLTHYDLLATRGAIVGLVDRILALASELGEFPFDLLILDESTKVKNSSTARYKALKKIAHLFERRIVLTGTPAPNGLHDLFGQITIADLGKRLGRNVTTFRKAFFYPETIPGAPGVFNWIPQRDAEQRIFEKIGDMALRMQAEDYLDMPELQFNTIAVDLPAGVMRTYKAVAKEFFAGVASGNITAANAATAAMKLRQVASGTVYTDAGTEQLHDAKLEALVDLIDEQNGQPLMVCVAFRAEAFHLRDKLEAAGYGRAPVLIGGVSDSVANQIENDWNAGKVRVLICHPATVALGLNLQAGGNAVCWYSLTWNLEEFDQTNRRVWRQGQQSKTCVMHILAAEGTIDTRIASTLSSKDADQRRLFNSLLEQ